MRATLNSSNWTKKLEPSSSIQPPGSLRLLSFHLWTNTWTGMNKRKGNKKQMSLSQSLFRSKVTKKEPSSNKTVSITKGDHSTITKSNNDRPHEDSRTISRPRSQPEADDFDDSFDLFLPRKNQPRAHSSQSSFFEVKKRSKYFNERGELRVPKVVKDDDLELALAVSLQESEGAAVALKPPKLDGIETPLLKLPRTELNQRRGKHKLTCSNSLLMRRTSEERERIITEKLAIVLMDKGKDASARITSGRVNESFPLYSSHLKKRIYEMKTLWTLAQTDLSQVKLVNFFIDAILHYLPSNCMDDVISPTPGGHSNVSRDKPLDVVHRAHSSEDMFVESDDGDSDQTPSPKRVRLSQCSETLNDPEVEISVNCSPGKSDELSLKVDSLDIITLEVDGSDSSVNVTNSNCQGGAHNHSQVNENPLKSSKSPPQCHKSIELPSKPPDVLKHYLKLSADMMCVSNSGVSRVSEVTSGSRIFFAHHCIFKVRCPVLLEELERNPGCLTDYNSKVCEALFGYIYAADIASCLKMDSTQKTDLLELAKKFHIKCLVEELEKTGVEGCTADTEKSNFSFAPQDQPNGLDSFPGDVETFEKPHSTAGEIKCTEPVGVQSSCSDQVVILDSDSCSVEEILDAEGPASECVVTEDEDLDKYLRIDLRFMGKKDCGGEDKTPRSSTNRTNEACKSPFRTVATKKSIDRYFEDSFPSLTDVDVAVASPLISENKNAEPESSSNNQRVIVDCLTPGGQVVVSERATPLPDYDTMLSPELKASLHKYGIRRGIGRRKAVTLLRYIYDQIHPPADHPAVTKALDDVKNSAQPKDGPSAESDNDVFPLSSESSGDFEMFEDLGDVTSSQPLGAECERSSLQLQVGGFIKSNTVLYAALLSYEPIWLNKFHETIKDHGIKCNKRELMDVLDELGITFRTEQTEKQKQRIGPKRKTRKKR